MKKREFEEQIKRWKVGDYVKIYCRGNYGTYAQESKFVKVEDGRVYLQSGMAHSYKRILSMLP